MHKRIIINTGNKMKNNEWMSFNNHLKKSVWSTRIGRIAPIWNQYSRTFKSTSVLSHTRTYTHTKVFSIENVPVGGGSNPLHSITIPECGEMWGKQKWDMTRTPRGPLHIHWVSKEILRSESWPKEYLPVSDPEAGWLSWPFCRDDRRLTFIFVADICLLPAETCTGVTWVMCVGLPF